VLLALMYMTIVYTNHFSVTPIKYSSAIVMYIFHLKTHLLHVKHRRLWSVG